MSIAPAADVVHLWTDDDAATTRLVWAGRRYRILTAGALRAVAHTLDVNPSRSASKHE